MTPQDNWQQELARLGRRQDQLEQQQRETGMQIESSKMDADSPEDGTSTGRSGTGIGGCRAWSGSGISSKIS